MKAIKCIGLCCLISCLFMACGNSSSNSKDTLSVTGENGQTYESYQECCAANDYQAAHQFLAKLQNSKKGKEQYEEAKEYVFKNEALYLMSLGDETAKKRIVYLLKEEDGNNDHVAMLIDLAIENDDEMFVKTLANQYTARINKENIEQVIDYLKKKSPSDNYPFLESFLNRLNINDVDIKLRLYDFSNPKNNEHILSLLSAFEDKIPIKPKVGKLIMSEPYYNNTCDDYNDAVKEYNNQCRKILKTAITNKNQALAQKVLNKFKSCVNCIQTSHGFNARRDYEYRYNITIDNEDINSAKSAYQEAVRSGAFR